MKPFFIRLLAAALLVATTWAAARAYYVPAVVRQFQWHRASFEQRAARILNTPDLADGADAPLDEGIAAAGITYVRKRGDCVVFIYQTWVTDPSWQIIYTPDGFRGLPVKSETGGPFNHILRIQKIDEQWYCWQIY